MKREQLDLLDYLNHILEAIARIDEYTSDIDEVTFLEAKIVQDAVIRNFENIGEASHNIQKYFPSFVESNPDIHFVVAYQMRNALSHGYFSVDLEIVWKTIHTNLTPLQTKIQQAIFKLT